MKKILILVLALFMISMMAFYNECRSQGLQKEPYKIGACLPLTGYLSWVGEYRKKAAELKVDIINEAGGIDGHPLKLIIYDDKSSPEIGMTIAQRLISQDMVVAVTGTASVPITGPVSSLCNKFEVPAVLVSGYVINHEKEPYTFNIAYRSDFSIETVFRYFKKNNMTKIASLQQIGSLGELGTSLGRQIANKIGLTMIGEEKFDVKSPDVTTQLSKLRTLNPDAVFSFSTGEPAALVARNMAQLRMNIPLFVTQGNANPGFLKMVSDIPITIIVPSGKIVVIDSIPDSDPVKKVVTQFNEKHLARYGEPATPYSGEGADCINLIAEALRVVGSADRQKVRDAIEKIKNYVGVAGVYNFSPTDHYGLGIENLTNFTIKNGKWQLLQ
jgi:branched-chain amino acid transport system substrate-binding protein